MTNEIENSEVSEIHEEEDNESQKEIESEEDEENKGVSRFSDEGMETEIEVKPDENPPTKRKKKKKKREDVKMKEEEIEVETKQSKEKENGDHPLGATNGAIHTGKVSDAKASSPEKKEQIKTKLRIMKKDRCYPLYLAIICKICILLPIGIYTCDVLLGVNVMVDPKTSMDLVKNENNFFNGTDAPLLSVAGHPYKHLIPDTILAVVQRLSKERVKRQVDVGNVTTNSSEDISSTTSLMPNELQTTSLTPAPTEANVSKPNGSDVTMSPNPVEDITTTSYANETISPFVGHFCESELYFIQEHEMLTAKTSNKNDREYDWFISMNQLLYKYQQAYFFMFTVIGFLFLLTSIGMRVDAILNEKWSSSLLLIFLLYSISMSLTAKAFALQTGSNGVRCFLCRLVSYCRDIDPWELTPDIYFPTAMNWNTVAFASIVLKVYDCFVIGIVTLKYILDPEKEFWWVTFLKIIGWVIAFPMMIITPMAGVVRYSVIPVTMPDNSGAKLGFEMVFYIGVVFWVMALAVLPFFCKTRMCSRADDFEDEEEYY